MFSFRLLSVSSLAIMALALASGCQSMGMSGSSAVPQKAVVVSAGQGGATTVFVPSADGEHVEMLSSTGGPVCPQCEADALTYFKTGKLVEKCSVCGATRTAVTMVPDTHAHN